MLSQRSESKRSPIQLTRDNSESKLSPIQLTQAISESKRSSIQLFARMQSLGHSLLIETDQVFTFLIGYDKWSIVVLNCPLSLVG